MCLGQVTELITTEDHPSPLIVLRLRLDKMNPLFKATQENHSGGNGLQG